MSAKMIGLARIGRDAEVRFIPSGEAVSNLSLAFNYGKKDQDNKQPAQWVDATLWGKRAESLAPYLLKGQAVMVTLSDVHIETYQGQNGQGHKLSARVDDIEFAGSPPQQQGQGAQQQRSQGQQRQQPAPQQRSQGNQQRPAAQRQAPQGGSTGGYADDGFSDMSDDIPF